MGKQNLFAKLPQLHIFTILGEPDDSAEWRCVPKNLNLALFERCPSKLNI